MSPHRQTGHGHSVVAVDVGNTSTAVAWVVGNRVKQVWRLPTRSPDAAGTIARFARRQLRSLPVEGSVLCSVVPARNPAWRRALKALAAGAVPVEVCTDIRLGITVDYPRPDTIGADRLANAVAAQARFGAPVIVADFGTALTFDLVDRRSAYVGGIICPGLPLMLDYLAERTALLPHIEPRPTGRVVGRSTVEAMRIGATLGYRGMVREILTGLSRERGFKGAHICATGGYAAAALHGLGLPVSIDPLLTMKGLALIYARNRGETACRATR